MEVFWREVELELVEEEGCVLRQGNRMSIGREVGLCMVVLGELGKVL